jgi:hypothetical protein
MIICYTALPCIANVKSSSGNIHFDTSNDGTTEMTLNGSGLGIGVSSPSANLEVQGNTHISDRMSIGSDTSGSSNLNITGSFATSVQAVSSNVTLGNHSMILANSSSDNLFLTLPYAGNVKGRVFQIKKTSLLNHIWIYGGGNFIDGQMVMEMGATNRVLPYTTLISDGQNWHSLSASSNVSNIMSSDNLVGYWNFNETSGTIAADSSPAGNNPGTLGGGFTFSGNSALGKLGNCLDFDGSDDRVDCGTHSSLNITNNLTLIAWINADTATQDGSENRHIIARRSSSGSGAALTYGLRVKNTNSQILFNWHAASAYKNFTISNTAITTGTWHHVAITISGGSSYTAYFDGQSIEVGTLSNALESGDRNLYIGSFNGDKASWDGKIDEVRVYNRALNASEIQHLYIVEK